MTHSKYDALIPIFIETPVFTAVEARIVMQQYLHLIPSFHIVEGRKQAAPAPPVVAKGSIPFIYRHEKFLSTGGTNLFTP